MTEWRNWSGSVVAHPAVIARPRDEAELARVVREAPRLRVAGAGHSFSPLCETDGVLLQLADMEGELAVAPDRRTVEAPAGWSLARLTEALWAEGLSLPNQGDVNGQALGGALATGTHGTGRELGSLATLAEAFRLVLPSGEVVECDALREPDLFQAARLSLGLVGVATRVHLRVLTALHLEERIERRPLGEVLESLDELAARTRHMEFFLFPYANAVLLKTLHPCEPGPDEVAEEEADDVFRACCELMAAAPRSTPMIQRTLTRLWRSSARRGPAWKIFPSQRDLLFEEMEYEVPAANAAAALRAVVALTRERRMPLAFPFEFRFVAGDDLWLSPFNDGPRASISVHQYHRMEWAPHFAELEDVLRAHGGRPHWGKRHTLDGDDVRGLYPRSENFGRVRRAVDPEGKLMNDHARVLFGWSL